MTPETAAAVMAERSAVCSLLSSYDFGPEYTRDRMERAIAAIRARPAPVVEPARDGAVRQALASLIAHIEHIAYRDAANLRLGPVVPAFENAVAALADLQRAEG